METKHLEELLNRALIEREEVEENIAKAIKMLKEIQEHDVIDTEEYIEDIIKVLRGE